jgi:hypothetical protein
LLPFFMVSFNVLQIDFHIERTWDKKAPPWAPYGT